MKLTDTAIALIATLFLIGVIAIDVMIGLRAGDDKAPRRKYVDSIIAINDSLDNKVKTLDSIANEEIIKVRNLDNDSTVKLFKVLVSE